MGFSEVKQSPEAMGGVTGTQAAVSLLFSCGQSRGSQMLMKPLGSLRHQCLSGPGLSWSGHSPPTSSVSELKVLESSDTQLALLYQNSLSLHDCSLTS